LTCGIEYVEDQYNVVHRCVDLKLQKI